MRAPYGPRLVSWCPHIEPLAAQARPVRSRGHRVKHDTRMPDRPQHPAGAVNVLILGAPSR